MKLSYLRLVQKRKEGGTWMIKALVRVETGRFFKTRVDREICKKCGAPWYFVDTGEFCPGHQAENLAQALEAGKRGHTLTNMVTS